MKENTGLQAPIEVLIKNPDPAVLQEYFVPSQIEIIPRDDNWLLGSERTWEEIDVVLEGRLTDMQDWNETKFNTGTNQARILAYTQMLFECGDLIEGYDSQMNQLNADYEKSKTEIRGNKRISVGKQSKHISLKWNETEPKIKELDKKKSNKSKVGDLILKKAFLDMFSITNNHTLTQRPMVIDSIRDVLDDTRKIITNNTDSLGEKFAESNPVDYLLSNLGNQVDDYVDADLLKRFSYKANNGIASKRSDVEVISSTLQVFNSHAFNKEGQEPSHNISLAAALFNVMYKKAEHDSKLSTGETEYPYLTFFYDVVTSATYKSDPTVVEMSMLWLDRILKNKLSSNDLRNEIATLAENHESLLDNTSKAFEGTAYVRLPKQDFKVLSSEDVKEIPFELKKYFLSEENRLLYIFEIVGNKFTETNKQLYQLLSSAMVKARTKHGMTLEKLRLEKLHDNIDTLALKESEGVEISLSNLLSGGRSFIDGMGSKFKQIGSEESLVQNMMSMASYQLRDDKKTMVYTWFKKSEDARPGYFRQLFKENEILSKYISNRAMWFVSPRGDMFSSLHDKGLNAKAIDFLTFYIDHQFPREHKVVIKYNDTETPLEFWLDENQNLLGEGHTSVSGDPRLITNLKNTILQRLYFITSGLLSKKPENYIAVNATDEEKMMFRRAHYGTLKSTANRTITMSSPGVDTHAGLIKSIYGIDIFAEIKRRRAMGTLKPYEYLTFWQEVVKGNINLFKPNEVIFDPSLINLDLEHK